MERVNERRKNKNTTFIVLGEKNVWIFLPQFFTLFYFRSSGDDSRKGEYPVRKRQAIRDTQAVGAFHS
jgi:hypothetical protein